MIDSAQTLEQSLIDTTEQARQAVIGDRLVLAVQEGVLALFTAETEEFIAIRSPKTSTDEQVLSGVQEIVLGALRDPEEQRLERAERRAFPGLVGSEDQVQAMLAAAQIQMAIGEWPEGAQMQIQDLHSVSP